MRGLFRESLNQFHQRMNRLSLSRKYVNKAGMLADPETGIALNLFHGSPYTHNINYLRAQSGKGQRLGKGVYLTNLPEYANSYAGKMADRFGRTKAKGHDSIVWQPAGFREYKEITVFEI